MLPTKVVQLDLGRPAFLPFHLLAWGQQFIRKHNCGLPESKTVKSGDANFKLYRICDMAPFRHKGEVTVTAYNESVLSKETTKKGPFKYVYFTESDQIVRFDSFHTMSTLLQASNSSCFFVGRRKEKDGKGLT